MWPVSIVQQYNNSGKNTCAHDSQLCVGVELSGIVPDEFESAQVQTAVKFANKTSTKFNIFRDYVVLYL